MATTLMIICMKDEADVMDQPEARANAPHSSLAAGSGAAAGETTVSPRNPSEPLPGWVFGRPPIRRARGH